MLLEVWLFGLFIILGIAGIFFQLALSGRQTKRIAKYLFFASIIALAISMIASFG